MYCKCTLKVRSNMIINIEKFTAESDNIILRGEMMHSEQYMLKALDYIDNNLAKDISLFEISREAGFSVPHFYRLFKRLTGDTVGAYILRRRLSLAARDLTRSKKTIADISFTYGFESHDVFTRAFTRVYGMSPNKYRSSSGPPPFKRMEVIENGSGVRADKGRPQMSFTLLESAGFYVAGMECCAKRWDADYSIGYLWSSFLVRAGEIDNTAKPMTMYGICEFETCSKEQFTYLAAVAINDTDNIPTGMIKRYIRPQKFFQADVPQVIGVPDAYTATIGYAKSLGYEMDEYDEIEVYDEIFRDPADHNFKLWIPIK
jgi:AraC family transcriptional regulator